jgi:hypothetical protein
MLTLAQRDTDAVNARFERILDALEGKLPAEGVDRTVSRDYSRLTVSSYVRGSHGRAGGAGGPD